MPDILPLILSLQSVLPKTTCRQLSRIVVAMLSMTGRITQLGISRWAGEGGSYRTVQRFFHAPIPWLEVQWLFFQRFLWRREDTYLLVGDETVVGKAGKQTFGLARFFSSLFDKPIPGVAFFGLALVSVQQRRAYPLCAEQIVRTPEEEAQAKQRQQKRKAKKKAAPRKPAGRPKGSKNADKDKRPLSPELSRILGWGQKALALVGKKISVGYLVLDGHFGNAPACQMTRQMGLHLISKMRHNAALFLVPTPKQRQEHPHLKYGDRLDYANLPLELRVSCSEEGGIRTEIYQVRCWNKEFAHVLNVVILVKTNLLTKQWGHVILFSSDLFLKAATLIDYYALRFQIEFVFRDCKGHFGLEDFMGRTKTSVANAAGLSFFLVNLSNYLLGSLRAVSSEAGVWDLKSYYRGRRYACETLKYLADIADAIICERVLEQVCLLGLIHPGTKPDKRAVSAPPQELSPGDCVLAQAA